MGIAASILKDHRWRYSTGRNGEISINLSALCKDDEFQSVYNKEKQKYQIIEVKQSDPKCYNWRHVMKRFKFKNVISIDLSNCHINRWNISSFTQKKWDNLKKLRLSNNKLGNISIKFLIKRPMPELIQLSLLDCDIESEGLKYIAKSTVWPKLTILTVNINKLGFEGLTWFYLNNFKEMKELILNDNRCGAVSILSLAACMQKKLEQLKTSSYNRNLKQEIAQITRQRFFEVG